MNLDPRSSINYDRAIERSKKANQGAKFQVGYRRMTAVEIANECNCSVQTVNKWVKEIGEDPVKFVNRMKRKYRTR